MDSPARANIITFIADKVNTPRLLTLLHMSHIHPIVLVIVIVIATKRRTAVHSYNRKYWCITLALPEMVFRVELIRGCRKRDKSRVADL